MANTSATKKDIRKSARRAAINQNKRSGIRTFLKKVETAIASGDKAGAKEALRVAQSEMMSGVTKNLYKLNTASRKISRLAARVKAIN
jgi:small subunit ribosomal protein S20